MSIKWYFNLTRGFDMKYRPPCYFFDTMKPENTFSIIEVADFAKITKEAIYAWLKTHPDFTDDARYIIIHGRNRYFTKQGVMTYMNLKDMKGKNRQAKTSFVSHNETKNNKSQEYKGKELIVNKVFDYATDPIISMRLKQLEHEERLHLVEERTESLLRRTEEAQQYLLEFPEATVEAPQRSIRTFVVEYVNMYVEKTGLTHREIWNKLYKEYSIRMKVNLRQRSTKENVKQLDYIDQKGNIEALYAIAKEILI